MNDKIYIALNLLMYNLQNDVEIVVLNKSNH